MFSRVNIYFFIGQLHVLSADLEHALIFFLAGVKIFLAKLVRAQIAGLLRAGKRQARLYYVPGHSTTEDRINFQPITKI